MIETTRIRREGAVRGRHWCSALALVAVAGCSGIRQSNYISPMEMPDPEWRVVYADDAYSISIDVAHVVPGPEPDSLDVWYQTRHAAMRDEAGKPWNREVIHSLLRCAPISFKTVMITVFLDGGPPVAQGGGTVADVASKPWKPVQPGTPDEGSLKAACAVLREAGHLS
jgi:hypothetical protein